MIAQVVSIFGDRLHQFSVVGMIGQVAPGSSVELFQFILFGHLPILLFAPLIGHLIDRANRATVLVVTDFFRGICVAVIPALYHLMGNMYAFYIPIFFLSMANLLFAPAKAAAIPEYFGQLKLLRINAALWGLGIIGTIGGFLLGGWFFDYRSWQLSFYTDAASYFISVIFLLPLFFLPHLARRNHSGKSDSGEPDVPTPARSSSLAGSIRDGINLIKTDRRIAYCLAAQAALFGVLSILYVVGVARIQEVLPTDRTIYLSLIAVSGTIGLLAGAGLASVSQGRLAFNRVIAHSTLLIAATLVALSYARGLIPIMIWAFVLGAAVSPISVITETLLQIHIPSNFRGRVFAAREVVTKTSFLAMSLLATLMTVALDKAFIILCLGVLLAVVGLWLERKDYLKI